jgi:hypothetical protein
MQSINLSKLLEAIQLWQMAKTGFNREPIIGGPDFQGSIEDGWTLTVQSNHEVGAAILEKLGFQHFVNGLYSLSAGPGESFSGLNPDTNPQEDLSEVYPDFY